MSRNRRAKENIRYWQFEGGYAQEEATRLRALLEGYRLGQFRRNEVRVFAARLEYAAKHPNCKKLDLARILNCNSYRKGNRRLSKSQIDAAGHNLDQCLPGLRVICEANWDQAGTPHSKPVPRKVLRHIAQGGATTVEALFLFAYFMRRIPQRKPMQRLLSQERYARIRYAEFQAWTGVHRASQCRMVRRLIERGFLNTVPVVKQNENAYGQLFIDGPLLSRIRKRQPIRRTGQIRRMVSEKKSTPPKQKVNATQHKTTTLRNVNPKKEIEEQERFVLGLKSGYLGRHGDSDLRRIAARAVHMVESRLGQVA